MYYISKHEQNSWHPDGSPVIPLNYLETTKWKDVLKWFKDHRDTTAILDSYLWIDDECLGKILDVLTCITENDQPTLNQVKESLQI